MVTFQGTDKTKYLFCHKVDPSQLIDDAEINISENLWGYSPVHDHVITTRKNYACELVLSLLPRLTTKANNVFFEKLPVSNQEIFRHSSPLLWTHVGTLVSQTKDCLTGPSENRKYKVVLILEKLDVTCPRTDWYTGFTSLTRLFTGHGSPPKSQGLYWYFMEVCDWVQRFSHKTFI